MKQFINELDNLSAAVKSERKCIIVREESHNLVRAEVCTSEVSESEGILYSYFNVPEDSVSIELCPNPCMADEMCTIANNASKYILDKYLSKSVELYASIDFALSNGLIFKSLRNALQAKTCTVYKSERTDKYWMADDSLVCINGYYVVLRSNKGIPVFKGTRKECEGILKGRNLDSITPVYLEESSRQKEYTDFLDKARVDIMAELTRNSTMAKISASMNHENLFANDELLLSFNNRDK